MKITSPGMLSHALKNARRERHLTQHATAELAGIKQATVSGFENHPERSQIETLFKLLSALELELYVGERDPAGGITGGDEGWDQEW
ncbi:helix-turn-helix domain-containing protein [Halomonas icarae]|uniref:Helix-turn-helix domain-containing protein n=1 Tax=Halomonas icarae TaxID=2691040 RepID=A0A7X5ALE5_9GAMM|nr:helix-turn-helix domain-containing protein [Halomonas icarae]MDR5902015.1 helix-turn-helix domain-containing protein [Halomonas icarae]NAW12285.1 helix-turn-helix domain-containing protein [Halomonas icarae]